MIEAKVEIKCDVCGKRRFADAIEMGMYKVVASVLGPAWTGWEAVEDARADGWMIDLQNKTVYCDKHEPEDVTIPQGRKPMCFNHRMNGY